jgi:mannose-6-phosphate isomerase-like protein (cupin superfamily)
MKTVQIDDVVGEAVSHNPDIIKKVLLNEHELPGSVRLSHALFSPGQKASAHRHEGLCEVFYVLSGCGQMIVDNIDYPLEQGSCIVVEAGELHELVNNGEEDMTVLYFGLNS